MTNLIEKATASQPRPELAGDVVFYDVMETIRETDSRTLIHKDDLLLMVRNRAEHCAKAYGQFLHSDDGRCTQTECLQEGLDLLSYLMKGYMQTGNKMHMKLFGLALAMVDVMCDDALFVKVGEDVIS